MCNKLINLTYFIPREFLHPSERAILLKICDYMKDEDSFAFPRQETLAKKAGFGLTQTKGAIKFLRENLLISVKKVKNKKNVLVNRYLANYDLLQEMHDKNDYSAIIPVKERVKKVNKSNKDGSVDKSVDNLCITNVYPVDNFVDKSAKRLCGIAAQRTHTPYSVLTPNVYNLQSLLRATITNEDKKAMDPWIHNSLVTGFVCEVLMPLKFNQEILTMGWAELSEFTAIVEKFLEISPHGQLLDYLDDPEGDPIAKTLTTGAQAIQCIGGILMFQMSQTQEERAEEHGKYITRLTDEGKEVEAKKTALMSEDEKKEFLERKDDLTKALDESWSMVLALGERMRDITDEKLKMYQDGDSVEDEE